MRINKGKGNLSTELRLVALMKKERLNGWRRGSLLPGKPDFIFPKDRLAVFVDGCFWHGCARCRRNLKPATNRMFWVEKIRMNKLRDLRVGRQLKREDWSVIRIWEHEIKRTPNKVLGRIRKKLI